MCNGRFLFTFFTGCCFGHGLTVNGFWHPFNQQGLTLISAWMNNHMLSKLWDENTYQFLNFKGWIVEVWEWISSFIPHITGHVITYPYRGYMPQGVWSSLVQIGVSCWKGTWAFDNKKRQKRVTNRRMRRFSRFIFLSSGQSKAEWLIKGQ